MPTSLTQATKNEHLHARDMAKLVEKLEARVDELEVGELRFGCAWGWAYTFGCVVWVWYVTGAVAVGSAHGLS